MRPRASERSRSCCGQVGTDHAAARVRDQAPQHPNAQPTAMGRMPPLPPRNALLEALVPGAAVREQERPLVARDALRLRRLCGPLRCIRRGNHRPCSWLDRLFGPTCLGWRRLRHSSGPGGVHACRGMGSPRSGMLRAWRGMEARVLPPRQNSPSSNGARRASLVRIAALSAEELLQDRAQLDERVAMSAAWALRGRSLPALRWAARESARWVAPTATYSRGPAGRAGGRDSVPVVCSRVGKRLNLCLCRRHGPCSPCPGAPRSKEREDAPKAEGSPA